MSLKVLFIGGTGNISLPCVAEAVAAGHRLSVFNRGTTSVDLPRSVTTITGDLKDMAYRELGRVGFDVICQFITFTPEQMADDIAAFAGGTGQFIFISSASVYKKPPRRYVITEETPTINPSSAQAGCPGPLCGRVTPFARCCQRFSTKATPSDAGCSRENQ
jgi:nucleoside-diphosphate-sugar epimerase